MVQPTDIKVCEGCGKRIYFSGSRMIPTEVDTNDPHKCIVDSSLFRKTASRVGSRTFSSSRDVRLTERAISNEIDRIASKAVVGDKKLEKRVEALEKRVKELEDQLLEKHDEIMMLKRQVDKLNDLIKSKG